MNREIKVNVKRVYGVDKIYIVSEHTKSVEVLTGRKTLTSRDIDALKTLGFSIKVVIPTVVL